MWLVFVLPKELKVLILPPPPAVAQALCTSVQWPVAEASAAWISSEPEGMHYAHTLWRIGREESDKRVMDMEQCECFACSQHALTKYGEQGQKKFSRHFIKDILEEDRPLDLSWGDGRSSTEEERLAKKKLRTTFSGWQIFELERIFEARKYINCAERKHLSR